MTENTQTQADGPHGLKYGVAQEFTCFFNVKPGHGQQIRELFETKSADEEAKRADTVERLSTLHDSRWVLFNDDTTVFCWLRASTGAGILYLEDFASLIPQLFDTILQHTEDYPGMASPKIKDWFAAYQQPALTYMRSSPEATVQDVKKALRVNKAFQEMLDAAG